MLLSCWNHIFLRVSLTPPHYEESFSSSGVHRELSSILKEIRVTIIACFIILADHIFIRKSSGKESFSAKNTSHKVLILIVLLQMQQHMSKRNHDVLILIMTITGDHRQAEGRRRCGRDRERLEVRGHGARQALPHHLHRLHRHRHRRRPRCCAACHCHIDINS